MGTTNSNFEFVAHTPTVGVDLYPAGFEDYYCEQGKPNVLFRLNQSVDYTYDMSTGAIRVVEYED